MRNTPLQTRRTPEWCVTYRYVGTDEQVQARARAETREEAIEQAAAIVDARPGSRLEFVDAVKVTKPVRTGG